MAVRALCRGTRRPLSQHLRAAHSLASFAVRRPEWCRPFHADLVCCGLLQYISLSGHPRWPRRTALVTSRSQVVPSKMLLSAIVILLVPLASASPVFRRETNVQLHPSGDTTQCLQFLAGSHGPRAPDRIYDDAPLSVGACDSIFVYNRFDISYGDQQGIKLSS